METTNTILKILPFISILLIFIVWIQNRRKKKLGIKEEEKSSKLKQWFKTTEVYKIFVERASLRPSSLLFYWFFVFPSFLLFIGAIVLVNQKPYISLKDMNKIEGYLTKVVWIKAGRGDDYIKLKKDDGNEDAYLILLDKKTVQELSKIIGKRVTVFSYQKYYFNIIGTQHIAEIKYQDKFLVGYDHETYTKNHSMIESFFYSTWFGLKIALIGFFFIFLLNYEEKPIHRLNRMKKYLKNKQKEEK